MFALTLLLQATLMLVVPRSEEPVAARAAAVAAQAEPDGDTPASIQ